jgi:hypothetical protein
VAHTGGTRIVVGGDGLGMPPPSVVVFQEDLPSLLEAALCLIVYPSPSGLE